MREKMVIKMKILKKVYGFEYLGEKVGSLFVFSNNES
jgi:hypothetical protein